MWALCEHLISPCHDFACGGLKRVIIQSFNYILGHNHKLNIFSDVFQTFLSWGVSICLFNIYIKIYSPIVFGEDEKEYSICLGDLGNKLYLYIFFVFYKRRTLSRHEKRARTRGHWLRKFCGNLVAPCDYNINSVKRKFSAKS